MKTRPGSLGQYEVFVDGQSVATRTRGLASFLGGGWPTADQVLEEAAKAGATAGAEQD